MMTAPQPGPWHDHRPEPTYPPLAGDVETDIAVVGGGLAGVLTAYLLAKAERRVMLLEQDRLGSGMTGLTTAFLTQVIDTDLPDLLAMFGPARTKQVFDAGAAAIDAIDQIARAEAIHCAFRRCDNRIYTQHERDVDALRRIRDAAAAIGVECSFTHRPVGLPFAAALTFSHQAMFHPLRFVYGAAAAAVRHGATILERTPVRTLNGQAGRFSLMTARGTVTARQVAILTHAPFHNPPAVRAKKGPYTTYVLEATIPQHTFPAGTYEDTGNPYHYFRIDHGRQTDRIILGGEDHREELAALAPGSRRSLERYLELLLHGVPFTVRRRWQGQILESIDGLPFIGAVAPNEYVATAFSGNGMTYAAMAAEIIRDAVTGRANPWSDLFDPTRLPTLPQLATKGRDYVQELWNGVRAGLTSSKR